MFSRLRQQETKISQMIFEQEKGTLIPRDLLKLIVDQLSQPGEWSCLKETWSKYIFGNSIEHLYGDVRS